MVSSLKCPWETGGSRSSLLSHSRVLFITKSREARTASESPQGAALRSNSTWGKQRWRAGSIPIKPTVHSQTAHVIKNLAATHFRSTSLGGKDHQLSSGKNQWFQSKQRPDSCSRFIFFNCILMTSIITSSAVAKLFIWDRNLVMTDMILQCHIFPKLKLPAFSSFFLPHTQLCPTNQCPYGEIAMRYSFAATLLLSVVQWLSVHPETGQRCRRFDAAG